MFGKGKKIEENVKTQGRIKNLEIKINRLERNIVRSDNKRKELATQFAVLIDHLKKIGTYYG